MHNHGLGAWMAKRRLKSPEKTALVFDGSEVTYRQLADGADRVSALLWQRGIRKGDRVAYLGENSPEFIQVMFGAAQLGAVFVPVNTRLAARDRPRARPTPAPARSSTTRSSRSRVASASSAADVSHVIETGEGTPTSPDSRSCSGYPRRATPTPRSSSTTPPRSSTRRARRARRRAPCSRTRTSRGWRSTASSTTTSSRPTSPS